MSWRCRICGGKVRWRSMVGRKPWNYSSNQFHVVPHSFKVAHISEGAWLAFPSGILHCFAKVIIPDIDSRLIASPLEHQMRCAQVWAVASWFLNGAGNVGCNYRDLYGFMVQTRGVGADDATARQKFRMTKEYSVDVKTTHQTLVSDRSDRGRPWNRHPPSGFLCKPKTLYI